jgi:SET domain-containing protein
VSLYVAPSPLHGLGVFTDEAFASGDPIEECPVLVIPSPQRELIDRTVFSGYYYEWGQGEGALALGFGSLYNHSYKPTARYDQADQGPVLIISAIRRISPGTEITINYNGNPRSRKRLWFEPAG